MAAKDHGGQAWSWQETLAFWLLSLMGLRGRVSGERREEAVTQPGSTAS